MCQCDSLFDKFQWKDITTVDPKKDLPQTRGLYILRVRERGQSVEDVISSVPELLHEIHWPSLREYIKNRVTRLKQIGNCPVIYVGAGLLRDRFKAWQFCHTVMYPVWGLLWAGWKIDYGWLKHEKSQEGEKLLKQQYKNIHECLPALVVK